MITTCMKQSDSYIEFSFWKIFGRDLLCDSKSPLHNTFKSVSNTSNLSLSSTIGDLGLQDFTYIVPLPAVEF